MPGPPAVCVVGGGVYPHGGMGDDEQRRYTLAEAVTELRRRKCVEHGHDFDVVQDGVGLPVGVQCARCGRSWEVRARGER